MQSDLLIRTRETVCAACLNGGEFLQHLQGLQVVPHCMTNEINTLNSWLCFDFAGEDAGVRTSSLHVCVTPAASHLKSTASHKADGALSSSAWVTANDQLRSLFSGFCVKWHTERSAVNDTYMPLFALNETQPPTSSESGCHQLSTSAPQPLTRHSVASGSRFSRCCCITWIRQLRP